MFPSTIQAGARAQTLLVNGSGFGAQSTVALDGKTRPRTFVSTFQLAADLAAEMYVDFP